MKKSVYIIGSAGIPSRYGGFEIFTENISKQMTSKYEVHVACSSKLYNKNERYNFWNSINRFYINLSPNGISGILYDLISLIIARKNADHVLILGCGIGPFLMFCPKKLRRKIIIHIDGLEWKRPKWNLFGRLYLYISTKLAIIYSGKVVVDNLNLFDTIPKRYIHRSYNIRYGGNHLPDIKSKKEQTADKYALTIARAVPENNIHLIISAFLKMKNVRLIIVSDWHKTRYGKMLYKKFADKENIKLIGPEYDAINLQKLRTGCFCYIHGHSCGGTNPSLVEAMFSGLDIVAHNNKFNRETTNNLAEYFSTEQELIESVSTLVKERNTDRCKLLKEYARKNYTWEKSFEDFEHLTI